MALRRLHDLPRDQTEAEQPAFFEYNAFLQALEVSSDLHEFMKRTESGLIMLQAGSDSMLKYVPFGPMDT